MTVIITFIVIGLTLFAITLYLYVKRSNPRYGKSWLTSGLIACLSFILTMLTYFIQPNTFERISFGQQKLIIPNKITFCTWMTPNDTGEIGGIKYEIDINNVSNQTTSITKINCNLNDDSNDNYIEYITDVNGSKINLPLVIDAGVSKRLIFGLKLSVPKNVSDLIKNKYIRSPFDVLSIDYNQLEEFLARKGFDIYGNKVENFFGDDSNLFHIKYKENNPSFPIYQLNIITLKQDTYVNNIKYEIAITP
jgi:hypothetical protein